MTEVKKYGDTQRSNDEGKPRYDLLPPGPKRLVGMVANFGVKYGERNYAKEGFVYSRCYASAQRHIEAWWEGEELDPETKLPHLAHAIWNLWILLWYQLTGRYTRNDDRYHVLPIEEPR